MKTFFRSFRMLFIVPFCSGLAIASPQAVVQVVDPFDGMWVRNELIDFYVRIVNVGDEIIDVSNGVFIFEQKNQGISHGDVSSWDSWIEFPRDEPAQLSIKSLFPETNSVQLEPKSSAVFNEGDFNPLHIMSWPLQDVRVVFQVDEQVLALSEWVGRIEVPKPNLIGEKPIYSYRRVANDIALERHIYKAELPSGIWLFAASGLDFERSARICRIPHDRDVISVSFDDDSGVLTVIIEGEDEAVKFDTGAAVAISGSSATVPHLHKWRSWADEPLRCVERRGPVISIVDADEADDLREKLFEGSAGVASLVELAVEPDNAKALRLSRYHIILKVFMALALTFLIFILYRGLRK